MRPPTCFQGLASLLGTYAFTLAAGESASRKNPETGYDYKYAPGDNRGAE